MCTVHKLNWKEEGSPALQEWKDRRRQTETRAGRERCRKAQDSLGRCVSTVSEARDKILREDECLWRSAVNCIRLITVKLVAIYI